MSREYGTLPTSHPSKGSWVVRDLTSGDYIEHADLSGALMVKYGFKHSPAESVL